MIDKLNFMETLRSVAEITKTSNEPLSKEEIQGYFTEMELSEEQKEMVYQYLLNVNDEPEIEEVSEEAQQEKSIDDGNKATSSYESAFFQMYLSDINDLPEYSKKEEEKFYEQLFAGEEEIIATLSDLWLRRVLDIAKEYEKYELNMEDIVQEGNMGLLYGLHTMLGHEILPTVEDYLRQSIKEAIEAYVDEMLNEDDWESTVLGKASLVHEAKRVLAETLGHDPSNMELSDYTKLTTDEILDIEGLVKEMDKK